MLKKPGIQTKVLDGRAKVQSANMRMQEAGGFGFGDLGFGDSGCRM